MSSRKRLHQPADPKPGVSSPNQDPHSQRGSRLPKAPRQELNQKHCNERSMSSDYAVESYYAGSSQFFPNVNTAHVPDACVNESPDRTQSRAMSVSILETPDSGDGQVHVAFRNWQQNPDAFGQ